MTNHIPVREIKPTDENIQTLSNTFSIRELHPLTEKGDIIQALHRHNFYYILIVKTGTGTHHIDFIKYAIGNYTIFFMAPGQVHELHLHKESTGYIIEFTADLFADMLTRIPQLLGRMSTTNYYSFGKEVFSSLYTIIDTIFEEQLLKKGQYLEVIKCNLHLLFIHLQRVSNLKEDYPYHTNNLYKERYEEFTSLITANLCSNRQVSFYAAQLNLTTYQLNTITKTSTGKSASEVINDYFMLEAKRYLLATTLQVNEVAWKLGIEDVSYFIRYFKKRTTYSPENFRKVFSSKNL